MYMCTQCCMAKAHDILKNYLAWGDVEGTMNFRDDMCIFFYAVFRSSPVENELFLIKLQLHKVK